MLIATASECAGKVSAQVFSPMAGAPTESTALPTAPQDRESQESTSLPVRASTVSTDSNVTQSREKGGWVKAMAYVDPFASGGIAITRCYNSQQTGAAVSTPPCGISIVFHDQGDNILDFGFEVDDRFISATSYQNFVVVAAGPYPFNSNQIEVGTIYVGNASPTDSQFYIFVF
jgi:hypothetical protein